MSRSDRTVVNIYETPFAAYDMEGPAQDDMSVLYGSYTRESQRGIQRQRATLAEKTGNLTQKNRCEISPAFIDSLAHVATDEEGIGAKRLAKFSAGIRRFRESQDMDKFDVAQFGRPSGQRFRQLHRYACAAAEIDATA